MLLFIQKYARTILPWTDRRPKWTVGLHQFMPAPCTDVSTTEPINE